jgi:hypothetical protein
MKRWYTPAYPYKQGTRLISMLRDGWARGFDPEQTYIECSLMGYVITQEFILRVWRHEDRKYARFVQRCGFEPGFYPDEGG